MLLTLLKQAETLGALRPIDYHFARWIAPQGPVAVAAALLSYESHLGHICLPLQWLSQPEQWFEGGYASLANQIWQQLQQPNLETWEKWLQSSDAVGDGQTATPLVLENQHLYHHRWWHDECSLARFFQATQLAKAPNQHRLQKLLTQLFADGSDVDEINWQKVAVAVALTRKIALIVGGPGSGKTTTVARLLATYLLLHSIDSANKESSESRQPRLRIQLAAATGKAAARLVEALTQAKHSLPLDVALLAEFPTEAITLHRLLGARNNEHRWRYHRDNRLSLDLLIIDEFSLVSFPLMARLIEALPSDVRLILLGDSDQLPAVESGALLRDLVESAISGYSPPRIAELNQLTGYSLPARKVKSSGLNDALCQLVTRYRFSADSALDCLAVSIRQGEEKTFLATLQNASSVIVWHESLPSIEQVIEQACVQGYRDYLEQAKQRVEPQQVLAKFFEFQLLCALAEGPFGVSGLNQRVEQALQQAGLITRSLASPWYCGRPILITSNQAALGLANGDIGVTLFSAQGKLAVYFSGNDGSVIAIDPRRLTAHQTTYALTVHKAQGSESLRVLLLLPPSHTPLLTRELLYTAVTRAKKQLILCADKLVLQAMLKSRCQRYSQLPRRLSTILPVESDLSREIV